MWKQNELRKPLATKKENEKEAEKSKSKALGFLLTGGYLRIIQKTFNGKGFI